MNASHVACFLDPVILICKLLVHHRFLWCVDCSFLDFLQRKIVFFVYSSCKTFAVENHGWSLNYDDKRMIQEYSDFMMQLLLANEGRLTKCVVGNEKCLRYL